MALKIPCALLDQLRQHGEETYPHECCGVLVGQFDDSGGRIVVSITRCGNTRTESLKNRYHISPSDVVRIQREALAAGHDVVGFYHSHPDHPAEWSATDLTEAHWTDCSYVITSVEGGHAVLTNSFVLQGQEEVKHFKNESIECER